MPLPSAKRNLRGVREGLQRLDAAARPSQAAVAPDIKSRGTAPKYDWEAVNSN